jgi:hypothetical protein
MIILVSSFTHSNACCLKFALKGFWFIDDRQYCTEQMNFSQHFATTNSLSLSVVLSSTLFTQYAYQSTFPLLNLSEVTHLLVCFSLETKTSVSVPNGFS